MGARGGTWWEREQARWNGDGDRDRGRERNEDVYGNEHEGIDGARTGVKTRTRVEMRVEGRERLEILEEVIEAGRKTREGGRRLRATINHSHKARRPSETVASC